MIPTLSSTHSLSRDTMIPMLSSTHSLSRDIMTPMLSSTHSPSRVIMRLSRLSLIIIPRQIKKMMNLVVLAAAETKK